MKRIAAVALVLLVTLVTISTTVLADRGPVIPDPGGASATSTGRKSL